MLKIIQDNRELLKLKEEAYKEEDEEIDNFEEEK